MDALNLNIKCIRNSNCFIVCTTKNCNNNPFMCNDEDCYCASNHQNCKSNIKWKKIRQILQKKIINPSADLKQYLNEIQQLFKTTLKQIQISFMQIKLSSTTGLSEVGNQIYNKIKLNRLDQLNGSLMNQLQSDLDYEMFFQKKNIQKQKQQIKKQTQILIKMFQSIIKLDQKSLNISSPTKAPIKISSVSNNINFDSRITNDIQTISSFFNKKILKFQLLYRASQNNFEVKKFWQKCNGKNQTLTLVKTQFEKVIGGYNPYPWNQNLSTYYIDNQRQTFVFTITQKHKIPLSKYPEYSTLHHQSFGPTFGGGDLNIRNNANITNDSNSNIGHSYSDKQYIYENQKSIQKFSGQKNGKNFIIKEWEVHRVIFE